MNDSFGISFDFWNTLYANGEESERARLRESYFYKVASRYTNPDRERISTAFRGSTALFLNEWRQNFRTPTAEERIRYIAAELNLNLSHPDIIEIGDYFGRLIFEVPPQKIAAVDQVIPVLAKSHPLAIISDTGYISGKYIRYFLKEEGLLPFFTSLVFSDEHPNSKPHRSVFQTTCSTMKTVASRLIHIGDLEHTDVAGIKNFGGISIKFTGADDTASDLSDADFQCDSYPQLPSLIDKIASSESGVYFS
ncbi:MAG: HAD family hydrolase [Calditrichales bacterium]|nr:MAG: HAD family hydrolase [Calditrichales bacterium]